MTMSQEVQLRNRLSQIVTGSTSIPREIGIVEECPENEEEDTKIIPLARSNSAAVQPTSLTEYSAPSFGQPTKPNRASTRIFTGKMRRQSTQQAKSTELIEEIVVEVEGIDEEDNREKEIIEMLLSNRYEQAIDSVTTGKPTKKNYLQRSANFNKIHEAGQDLT